jgi:subtilisin family serine protease
MQKPRHFAILAICFLIVLASLSLAQTESSQILDALAQNEKLIEPTRVLADFQQGRPTTRVIVNLAAPMAAREQNFKDLAYRQSLKEGIQAMQDLVINSLDSTHVRITNRFTYVYGFSAEVTPEGLKHLTEIPEVVSINNDIILQAHLAQGIPLIDGAAVRSQYNGSGMSIAICDTGIDYTHPRLGNGGFPNSKVLGGYDTGQNDVDPMDGNGHGTACAGIAAGDLGTTGDYIGGVAPGAKLYALKMTYNATVGSAYTSDMIEAWEWCVTHQNDNPSYPIMVISTSFGGSYYTSTCDTAVPAMTTAAQNAVAAGITLFVSSGNDGFCNGMGWPACITHVNSVGAVYDANIGRYPPVGYVGCISASSCAGYVCGSCSGKCYVDNTTAADQVTTYSNSASFLHFFAPSNNAYTLWPVALGSYRTDFGGTSAACPYAAGAAAVLQHAAKVNEGAYLTPATVRSQLQATGNYVTDGKAAVTKPRINLGNAASGVKHACCVTGAKGCNNPDIEAAVCAADPYCCTTAWDSLCVAEVETIAGDTCDCCSYHSEATGCWAPSPPSGKTNTYISQCVCAVDPYCCETRWDSLCQSEVESLGCAICPDGCPAPTASAKAFPANGATKVKMDSMLSWNCDLADAFEDQSLSEYTPVGGGTFTVTAPASHDGFFGLDASGAGGWIYRNDASSLVAQGETISFWVRPKSNEGRAYAGFGASAAGTYSVVIAPNTGQFLLQRNNGWGYLDIGSSAQAWQNKWYRVEVRWGAGGQITAVLYDSNGTTVLNTVSALDSTYTAGGIAFRGFDGSKFFDSVQVCKSPVPAITALSQAAKERYLTVLSQGQLPQTAPTEKPELVWDENNQGYTSVSNLNKQLKAQDFERAAPQGFVLKEGDLVPDDGTTTPAVNDDQSRSIVPIAADASSKYITFDNVSAPCNFANTVRLTDAYSSLGVIFQGPGGNDGGAILDECGNFGVSGYSSPNFLAFNSASALSDGGIPRGPETIHFSPPVSEVQAIVGSGSGAGQTLTMQAYNAESVLVSSATVTLAATMKPIKVSGQGIVRVVISTAAAVFVLDDLTWGQWCPVAYDVFFGTTNPPATKICSDTQSTFCDPGNLAESATYYWRVATKSPGGTNSGSVWAFTTGKFCECDLNNTGNCNILDYQIFIQDWGRSDCNTLGVFCECDLNLDGACNILDYQLFIQNWGQSGCSIP